MCPQFTKRLYIPKSRSKTFELIDNVFGHKIICAASMIDLETYNNMLLLFVFFFTDKVHVQRCISDQYNRSFCEKGGHIHHISVLVSTIVLVK